MQRQLSLGAVISIIIALTVQQACAQLQWNGPFASIWDDGPCNNVGNRGQGYTLAECEQECVSVLGCNAINFCPIGVSNCYPGDTNHNGDCVLRSCPYTALRTPTWTWGNYVGYALYDPSVTTRAPTMHMSVRPTSPGTFPPTESTSTTAPTRAPSYDPCTPGVHNCDVNTTFCVAVPDGNSSYTCECRAGLVPSTNGTTSCVVPPTGAPTLAPTVAPTSPPTSHPTPLPTTTPTLRSSFQPTTVPTTGSSIPTPMPTAATGAGGGSSDGGSSVYVVISIVVGVLVVVGVIFGLYRRWNSSRGTKHYTVIHHDNSVFGKKVHGDYEGDTSTNFDDDALVLESD